MQTKAGSIQCNNGAIYNNNNIVTELNNEQTVC